MQSTERRNSSYNPGSVGVGIVHLGLGAFHRAHQAAYIESWLDRNRGGDWGICAANIRSNARLVEQLARQDNRYHIVAFADRDSLTVTAVNAIREALFARDDQRVLLERMTAPATRIISLTVTEKGYYLNPATGELLTGDPAIDHDTANPTTPRTAPGLIVEALRRRRVLGLAPFTVLCCDNMPDNGSRTRHAVVSLAKRTSPGLADWIASEVAFPASMVDRIVPAVSPEMLQRLETILGFPDPAAVACEAFSQWVIEDRFPSGRPDWEADGVEMVADVKPFEITKLRLLNGAHSLLAYTGLLRGQATVAEAIRDPSLRALIDAWFDEASASLTLTRGIDLDRYRADVLARFRNDALEHRLSQIAMDGSQKIPQRWLEGAAANLARGAGIGVTARAVAAWMLYVRGGDRDGVTWAVEDPLAAKLAECHRLHESASEIVSAILRIRDVFPETLASNRTFGLAVLTAFRELAGES